MVALTEEILELKKKKKIFTVIQSLQYTSFQPEVFPQKQPPIPSQDLMYISFHLAFARKRVS